MYWNRLHKGFIICILLTTSVWFYWPSLSHSTDYSLFIFVTCYLWRRFRVSLGRVFISKCILVLYCECSQRHIMKDHCSHFTIKFKNIFIFFLIRVTLTVNCCTNFWYITQNAFRKENDIDEVQWIVTASRACMKNT